MVRPEGRLSVPDLDFDFHVGGVDVLDELNVDFIMIQE